MLRIGSQIKADNYTFDIGKEFIYLLFAVTTKSDVNVEIKSSITLANMCYYGVNRQLIIRDFSRTIELILYKMLILSVLFYGAEAWTLINSDAAALTVCERKVLRMIFGKVRVGDDFCIRFNSELCELLNDMHIVQRINIQRLHWLGHVVRIEGDPPARRVLDAGICGSRRRGRTRSGKSCHRLV